MSVFRAIVGALLLRLVWLACLAFCGAVLIGALVGAAVFHGWMAPL